MQEYLKPSHDRVLNTSFWTHHSLTNQLFDAAEPRLMTAPINKPKPITSTTLQARPSSLIACVVSSASQHVVTISNTVRWTQSIEGSSVWNKRDRQCDLNWFSSCCFSLRAKNVIQFHYGRRFLSNVLFSAITLICIRITVDQWSRNSSQKTQLYLYVRTITYQLHVSAIS